MDIRLPKLGERHLSARSGRDSDPTQWSRPRANTCTLRASPVEGDDPVEVAQRYIQSPEAANDAKGFDVADILGVDSMILVPSASSPLR